MTREEFIKQRCEIDKITEEEFEKRYRVVKCNCGQPYCKGYRCLDLDGLLKENQSLKEQLEEYKKWYKDELQENSKLSELWCDSRAKIRKLENQQKEFIKWLEDYLNLFDYRDIQEQAGYDMLEEILQKYREIIGGGNK